MAKTNKKTDPQVKQILDTLHDQYGKGHPKADIEAYRYNSASIRIRIIDPAFAGKDRVDREKLIWPVIQTLPDDVRAEIKVLLLIPPEEKKKSPMSLEFDNPTPSRL